jgi:hypothetical protein
MNVQTGQAREDNVQKDSGQPGVGLPVHRGDPHNADLVPPHLMWQYQQPAEQWRVMWTEKDR